MPGKVKFDPARAVVVFAPQGQSHQMAALEPEDVPTEGARYESSASSSSSDDGILPVYLCALCLDAIVLGRGGTLWCSTCWSRHVFKMCF